MALVAHHSPLRLAISSHFTMHYKPFQSLSKALVFRHWPIHIDPLPLNSQPKDVDESRTTAVHGFVTLKHSLCSKYHLNQRVSPMSSKNNYVDMHYIIYTEPLPVADLHKPFKEFFLVPQNAL